MGTFSLQALRLSIAYVKDTFWVKPTKLVQQIMKMFLKSQIKVLFFKAGLVI